MSDITEAREVMEIVAGRSSGAVTQTQIRDAARALLAALPETPTTDDREALARAIFHPHASDTHREVWCADAARYPESTLAAVHRREMQAVDRAIAAGFRRSSPPTEEQVEAVKRLHGPMDSCSLAANGQVAQKFIICETCEVPYPCPTIEALEPVEAAARVGGEGA